MSLRAFFGDLVRAVKAFLGLPVVTREESQRLAEEIQKERESRDGR